MSFFKQHIKPVAVLLAICLVVSAALALTYSGTKGIIEQRALALAEQTRRELLPDAEGFEQLECSVENVVSVYADTAGGGYVITVNAKGYGGTVEAIIGIDAAGKIIGISITDHSETTGVGTRAFEADYLSRYTGESSADGVDTLSGATYSSRAVKSAVQTALSAYENVKGAK